MAANGRDREKEREMSPQRIFDSTKRERKKRSNEKKGSNILSHFLVIKMCILIDKKYMKVLEMLITIRGVLMKAH